MTQNLLVAQTSPHYVLKYKLYKILNIYLKAIKSEKLFFFEKKIITKFLQIFEIILSILFFEK